MTNQDVEREDRDGIAILRLNRGKANALDVELLTALDEACRTLARGGARAVVVTGADRMFSAGVDLRRLLEGGEAYLDQFLSLLDAAFSGFFALPIPVVAAINGHAIAGGCVLAAACDRRLMARGDAKLGITELLVGVPFPPIAFETMRLALTANALRDLVLTGRLIDGDEAHTLGLVDALVEPDKLIESAMLEAGKLSAIPRQTFALTKKQLRGDALAAMARQDEELGPAVRKAWTSPEVHASVREFVERTLR